MAPGDDFREVMDLMLGTEGRFRSARAEISLTVEPEVAEEANRRWVDWRFTQPHDPGMSRLSVGERRIRGPEEPEDFYMSYRGLDRTYRLWHERPDRWREEVWGPEGRMRRCVVFGSAWGPRWVYVPQETAIHDSRLSRRWNRDNRFTDLSFMFDPSEESFQYALLDDAEVHLTGREDEVAGREAVEVLATTTSWGHPPYMFNNSHAPDGTTDHLFLVDARLGVVLRAAARLEGREFYVAEATEVHFDEGFEDGTFRLQLPGVEFEG